MRKPTPDAEAYAWYTRALVDHAWGVQVDVPEEPQCGFFKRRLVRGGPYVAAKIWIEGKTDSDGNLIGDEVMRCEVNNQYQDPEEQWTWLASHPIFEAEFHYLTALRNYTVEHAPHEPLANPRKPIDWKSVPLPIFNRRKAQ